MKRLFLSVVVLAAVLGGCSSDEKGMEGLSNEIKVGASVYGTITKAPVVTGDPFTAAIAAFEGSAAPTWTNSPAWTNSVTLTAATEAGERVSLDISKTYPASGKVYIAAWYPNITASKGVVNFLKTGTEDVMWGGTVDGDKTTPVGAFSFTHALTQLNFQLQATDAYLMDNTKKVTKIEVLDARNPQSMTIADGTVTYASPEAIAVPGATELTLTSSLQRFGEALMVKSLDAVKIKLYYDDNSSTNEIEIKDSATKDALKAEAGKSHLITLNFQKTGEVVISATGTVAPWEIGAAGTGTIEQ